MPFRPPAREWSITPIIPQYNPRTQQVAIVTNAESAVEGAGLLSFDRSAQLTKANARWVAGGVNSNFRRGMQPGPLMFERGEGLFLFDADGNRLIDYYCGMGAMVLGHSPASVQRAVKAQVDEGILFAGQSLIEVEAARILCSRIPSAERVRFGSSGSEVAQAAMRLARVATGRRKI